MKTFWKMQSLSFATLLAALLFVFHSSPVSGTQHTLSRQPRQYLKDVLCLKNGFIPYPGGVTSKYILCVWIAARGRWYYYVYNCPPGSGFDPGRSLCVIGVTGAPTTSEGSSDATTSATTSAQSTTGGADTTTGAGSSTSAATTSATTSATSSGSSMSTGGSSDASMPSSSSSDTTTTTTTTTTTPDPGAGMKRVNGKFIPLI